MKTNYPLDINKKLSKLFSKLLTNESGFIFILSKYSQPNSLAKVSTQRLTKNKAFVSYPLEIIQLISTYKSSTDSNN